MAKPNIAAIVTAMVESTVKELGYELWDVEYARLGADWNLTVIIDKEDGITIDDCEIVHRAIEPILDENDPIDNFYYFNVSSPGIERELKNPYHILACMGEMCEAKLYAPLNGKKAYKGTLAAYENNTITLAVTEEEQVSLPMDAVSKLRTVYFD